MSIFYSELSPYRFSIDELVSSNAHDSNATPCASFGLKLAGSFPVLLMR
jgi:hypothetical protein